MLFEQLRLLYKELRVDRPKRPSTTKTLRFEPSTVLLYAVTLLSNTSHPLSSRNICFRVAGTLTVFINTRKVLKGVHRQEPP